MNQKHFFTPSALQSWRWQAFLTPLAVLLWGPITFWWHYHTMYEAVEEIPQLISWILLSLFAVGAGFHVYYLTYGWQKWYVELTPTSLNYMVGDKTISMPYAGLKKCEVLRDRTGRVTSILVQKDKRVFELGNLQNIDELGQQLARLAPHTYTTGQVWLSEHRLQPFMLYFLIAWTYVSAFFGYHIDFMPICMLGIGVLAFATGLATVKQSPKNFVVVALLILGWSSFYLANFFIKSYQQLPVYLSHPCSLIVQITSPTPCLDTIAIAPAKNIVFAPPADKLILHVAGFRVIEGLMTYPINQPSWLPAPFNPLPSTSIFEYEVYFPPQSTLFLAYKTDMVAVGDWSTQTMAESYEASAPDPHSNEPRFPAVVSPTGRYLALKQPDFYLLVDRTTGRELPLPTFDQQNGVTFSADEQSLFILTNGQLTQIETQTGKILQTTSWPAEWPDKLSRCLQQIQPNQFLVTLGRDYWWWDTAENSLQKLFSTNERPATCPIYTGDNWIFIHQSTQDTIALYDLQGQLQWENPAWGIIQFIVSPDGRYLAGSDSDYTYLFDFELLRQQP